MNQKKEKARQLLHAKGNVLPCSFPTSGCSGQMSTFAADPSVRRLKNKGEIIRHTYFFIILSSIFVPVINSLEYKYEHKITVNNQCITLLNNEISNASYGTLKDMMKITFGDKNIILKKGCNVLVDGNIIARAVLDENLYFVSKKSKISFYKDKGEKSIIWLGNPLSGYAEVQGDIYLKGIKLPIKTNRLIPLSIWSNGNIAQVELEYPIWYVSRGKKLYIGKSNKYDNGEVSFDIKGEIIKSSIASNQYVEYDNNIFEIEDFIQFYENGNIRILGITKSNKIKIGVLNIPIYSQVTFNPNGWIQGIIPNNVVDYYYQGQLILLGGRNNTFELYKNRQIKKANIFTNTTVKINDNIINITSEGQGKKWWIYDKYEIVFYEDGNIMSCNIASNCILNIGHKRIKFYRYDILPIEYTDYKSITNYEINNFYLNTLYFYNDGNIKAGYLDESGKLTKFSPDGNIIGYENNK